MSLSKALNWTPHLYAEDRWPRYLRNSNSQASADIPSKRQPYNSLSREWRINTVKKTEELHFNRVCCYVVSIFVGFYFMYTVVSNLSSVIVIHYLLNVSARCQINLLALNSLRLPSFELSWCWFLVKISF